MWGTDGGRHLHSKNRPVAYKLHIRENRIIVLPVNILTCVAHRLLGPHDTLPYVLIKGVIHRGLCDPCRYKLMGVVTFTSFGAPHVQLIMSLPL